MKPAQLVRFAIAGACLAVPSAALAKQTYLSCAYGQGGGGEQLEITADESAGAVSIFVPATGVSVKYPAAFSAARVQFRSRIGTTYVIDRTNLDFFVSGISTPRQSGKCRLTSPPKRVF